MNFSTIKAVVDKAGYKFVQALSPYLPKSVTLNGKKYELPRVTSASQMAWYFAAVARTAPSLATAALNGLKRSAGLPYDGEVAHYDESEARIVMGIDLMTIGAILTVLFPVVLIPTLISAMLAGFAPPPETYVAPPPAEQNPPNDTGGGTGPGPVPNPNQETPPLEQRENKETKKEGFSPLFLVLGFLLLSGKKASA